MRVPSRSRLIGSILVASGAGVILVALLLLGWRGGRTALAEIQDCEAGPYAQPLVDGAPRLSLEVATTEDERSRGLMFREAESLAADQGMLFVFEQPTNGGFWMMHTVIPLSIAFILEDGTILDIQDMEPLSEKRPDGSVALRPGAVIKTYAPPGFYRYALETNQGWFSAHNVRPGDRVLVCLEG